MNNKNQMLEKKYNDFAKMIFKQNGECFAVSIMPICAEKFDGKEFSVNHGVTIFRCPVKKLNKQRRFKK